MDEQGSLNHTKWECKLTGARSKNWSVSQTDPREAISILLTF